RTRSRGRAAPPRFFFQAEDGIRAFHVTGVQTCALPIFIGRGIVRHSVRQVNRIRGLSSEEAMRAADIPRPEIIHRDEWVALPERSEERRVGKESRSRWATDDWRDRARPAPGARGGAEAR